MSGTAQPPELAREIETFRSAHPLFGSVADTLLELADDTTVTPAVYDRVCEAIFTVAHAWLEAVT